MAKCNVCGSELSFRPPPILEASTGALQQAVGDSYEYCAKCESESSKKRKKVLEKKVKKCIGKKVTITVHKINKGYNSKGSFDNETDEIVKGILEGYDGFDFVVDGKKIPKARYSEASSPPPNGNRNVHDDKITKIECEGEQIYP